MARCLRFIAATCWAGWRDHANDDIDELAAGEQEADDTTQDIVRGRGTTGYQDDASQQHSGGIVVELLLTKMFRTM